MSKARDLADSADKDIAGTIVLDDITLSNDMSVADNGKVQFGTDNDLQIYHSGTESWIRDVGLSDLFLDTNGSKISVISDGSYANGKMADFVKDGAVTLYYDNAVKVATTATGIDVTGTITADGLDLGADYGDKLNVTGTGHFTGNVTLSRQTNDSGSTGLTFEKTRSTSVNGNTLVQSGDQLGYLAFRGNDGDQFLDGAYILAFVSPSNPANNDMPTNLQFWTTGSGESSPTERMRIAQDGRVGIGLGGATPGYMLHVNGGSNPAARFQQNNSTVQIAEFPAHGGAVIWMDGSNGDLSGSDYFGIHALNATDLAFSADGGEIRMTMKNDGKLGIGTDSPSEKLEVAGTAKADQYLIDAIAKDISDTAVDVFVYDTSKDSDGGAWRKRTQNTSWYNEALNTATRGARKEFPAVAVIVAKVDGVTIYDGDDPDMAMWMKFSMTNGYGSYLGRTAATVTSVHMLNGNLCVGRGNAGYGEALLRANFISEHSVNYAVSGWRQIQPIAGRDLDATSNVELNYAGINAIINIAINDVAMTVLPNASIDSATGLPEPTIAVATNNGISVIKDTGTVVDITTGSGGYTSMNRVSISPDGWVAWSQNDTRSSKAAPIPEQDKAYGFWTYGQDADNDAYNFYESHAFAGNLGNIPALVSVGGGLKDHIFGKVVSGSDGLTLIGLQKSEPAGVYGDANMPLIAYITSSYNTGWMQGNIKLATLSDTDTTNVTGSELVTNGTFDSNTTGWNAGTSTLSQTSGKAKVLSPSGGWVSAYQAITTVVGKLYTISTSVDPTTGGSLNGADVLVQNSSTLGVSSVILIGPVTHGTSATILSGTFTATATTTYIHLRSKAYASNEYTLFDNVTVRLAEEDRSWNGNGLQVFGTVTKSAVATGADLVGYSFGSNTNYLEQPYNSDLDFGTGDFSVMCWVKPDTSMSAYPSIVDRYVSANNESTAWLLKIAEGTSSYYFYSNNTSIFTATGKVQFGVWQQVMAVRRSGVLYFYLNGRLEETGAMTHSITSSGAKLKVSKDATHHLGNSNLALLRISATAPTEEQIKKIYNDEKHLFTTNAKATLYGTSNNPLAIAYDDDTELLHVGTSAGRSVFQGLNRVDNTTDAVGAAISASNGLVAED